MSAVPPFIHPSHNVAPWSMLCRRCGKDQGFFPFECEPVELGRVNRDAEVGFEMVPEHTLHVEPALPTLVYVSGPLTTGMLTRNVRDALNVGKILIDRGYVAIVPHEKIITEILHPMSYDEWLAYDFRIILRCDAVYRMPGESHGGDAEVLFSQKHGIPVYFSLDTLFACEPATRPRRGS